LYDAALLSFDTTLKKIFHFGTGNLLGFNSTPYMSA